MPVCPKTSWRASRAAEQEALAGTQGKHRIYSFGRRAAPQEDGKDVVGRCREKGRKAKAQLELNLANAIGEKRNGFYKYISNTRRNKNNLNFY